MKFIKHLRILIIIILAGFSVTELNAQKDPTTVGIQFRPILPSGLFDNQNLSNTDTLGTFTIIPKAGYGFGAVLRQTLVGRFGLETGITYAKRVYHTSYSNDTLLTQDTFRFISYEVPILGLIYVPMSDYSYMNAAFGLSLDFMPNDVATTNGTLKMLALRNYWVLPGLMANAGTEFRTKKSGTFYAGVSYHRMLTRLGDVRIEFHVDDFKRNAWITPLSGHYFSIDFKYFLPTQRTEPPARAF